MEQGLDFYRRANKFTVWPIDVGVKGAEPWVSEDHLIRSEVCDVEAFGAFLASAGYKEVKVVGNLPRFVKGSINVL